MMIRQITQKDVEEFYLNEPGIKDLGSLGQLRGQIRNYLEKMRRQGYLKNLEARYQVAVEKGWVVDYFKPPNDFRLKASIGSAVLWFKGQSAQERKVFVMEYSDFLCPFCKKVQGTLSDLRKKYADSVQFGYRHFPLHQEARSLSEAVECARDQGRFWQFQNLIFSMPAVFSKASWSLLEMPGGRASGTSLRLKGVWIPENTKSAYRTISKREFLWASRGRPLLS